MDERKETLRKMNICRFCFGSNEKELSNIYQKEPKTVPLPIQIMSCVSIEVFANDGLPQLICNNCKQQTLQSYIFRSNCKKTDDALKNYLLTGELINPNLNKSTEKTSQKRPLSKISPVKDVKIVSQNSSNDPIDVKKMKMDDGTEVITLCISQSEESLNMDESSQESILTNIEQPTAETQKSSETVEDLNEMAVDDETVSEAFPRPNSQIVETGIFSCEHCDKSYPLEQLLEMHMSNHHRKRAYACSRCDARFFTKYDMEKHEYSHTGEKPYSCTVCEKVFARESLLHRHEATHVTTPRYMCPECEKTFLSKELLDVHMKKHEKTRPFECGVCKKSFVFKQGLERHIASLHSEDKPFRCNYCEASFNTPIRLTRHITTHAGLRPYPCKICGRTFLLSHHLTRHMRSHYEKEPEEAVGQHKCDTCSMSFRRKDSLINHSAIHSMVNLKCVICNTSFENAKMVKDHITTHLQGLPFPCERCDYSFDTEEQLIEHEVKHAEMEYEEQIEQEVISEEKTKTRRCSRRNVSIKYMEKEDEEEEFLENREEIPTFHIPNLNDPSTVVPSDNTVRDLFTLDTNELTLMRTQEATKEQEEHSTDNGLTQLFKTETSTDDEDGNASDEEIIEYMEGESEIKPIYRVEGMKMYERKGPIQRKVPQVQPDVSNIQTVDLEEIDERPNISAITSDSLTRIPTKSPVNVKVGGKTVKVQKFIISKDEMKHMAKLGILEVKNGQVIMKTPGQPILNAKIKPVQPSDIENLIHQRTQNKPPKKQYDRHRNVAGQSTSSA